ncbi:FHA domain-containing protein [Monashia sp. NPDC004114]
MNANDSRSGSDDDRPTESWRFGAGSGTYRFSAEDMAAIGGLRRGTAMLIGVGGPVTGSRMLLWRPQVSIGRGPECLVWLPHRTVSRVHATLVRRDFAYELIDAGSLNSTFINRERIDRTVLSNGDEIQIGACRFIYFEGSVE